MLTKAAIGSVAGIATPARRGETLSGLFHICYAGMCLPAVGIGVVIQLISLTTRCMRSADYY